METSFDHNWKKFRESQWVFSAEHAPASLFTIVEHFYNSSCFLLVVQIIFFNLLFNISSFLLPSSRFIKTAAYERL